MPRGRAGTEGADSVNLLKTSFTPKLCSEVEVAASGRQMSKYCNAGAM